MTEEKVSITKTIKENPPLSGLLCLRMKNEILGRDYSLSVVFIGKKRSRKLNFAHRSKDEPTDILSFPLDKKNGEIFINPYKAKIKARLHSKTYEKYLAFLLIHGMLHLKGMLHGSKMESKEKALCRLFKI